MDPLDAANALRSAEPGKGFVPLFTEVDPCFSWDDARAVARARDDLRRSDGDDHIGYKLGWTSIAMREALGIERPNWGTLWSSQLITELQRSSFRHPKIEPELVYVAGRRLDGEVSPEEVCAAAGGWSVGLEVVDPRFVDFGFAWLDNTADNSSAGAIVVGELASSPQIDPVAWELTFTDGSEVRSGRGDAVMGSPASAVAWLVGQLAAEGAALESGMIVFTGGMAAPFDVAVGGRYRAACVDLDREVEIDAV